jgi:hypothetical protein
MLVLPLCERIQRHEPSTPLSSTQRNSRPNLSDTTHVSDVQNLPERLHVQSAPTLNDIRSCHRVCHSRRRHRTACHRRRQRLLFSPVSEPAWDLMHENGQCDEEGRDPLVKDLARTRPRLLVDCDERTSPALTHHEKPSRMPDPASPLAEEQSAGVTTTRSATR